MSVKIIYLSQLTFVILEYIPNRYEYEAVQLQCEGKPFSFLFVDQVVGPKEDRRAWDRWFPICPLDCILICFSVMNDGSYANAMTRYFELANTKPGIPIILVGTKIDLRDDKETLDRIEERKRRVMTPSDGEELKEKIGARAYFETSSKTNVGVDELFEAAMRVALVHASVLPASHDFNSSAAPETKPNKCHIMYKKLNLNLFASSWNESEVALL
jgi:hypothetical protein